MSRMLRQHIQHNVVGYVAIFCFAMGGTAYAVDGPLAGTNQVGAEDIINGEVQEPEIAANSVRQGELADASVGGAELIDDGVRGPDVQESSLDFTKLQARLKSGCAAGLAIAAVDVAGNPTCVGSGGPPSGPAAGDLAGTYPNPEIGADRVGSAEVAPNSLTAADVADTNSLGGAEIDEGSLGLTDAGGDAGCCRVQGEVFRNSVPFDVDDPTTFVDLGNLELRSTLDGDDDEFRICNSAPSSHSVIVYRGGAEDSAAAARDDFDVAGNGCSGDVDYNGGTTTAEGDFRVLDPIDDAVIEGFAGTIFGLDVVVTGF